MEMRSQEESVNRYSDDYYERVDNLAYVSGYDKTPTGRYCKLSKHGYMESNLNELQFRTNFNWLMGIMAQVNIHDKYWNVYITNRQILVANEYKGTHTLYAYPYSHVNELSNGLFMALSDYAKIRRSSKDYPEIRKRHMDKLVSNYEKQLHGDCNK